MWQGVAQKGDLRERFFLSRAERSLIRFRVKPEDAGGDSEVW